MQKKIYPILDLSTKPADMPCQQIGNKNRAEPIKYFTYIGGFTLKEAISICFKEGIADLLVSSFTWWGREEGQRPLYNTRLITAIYGKIFLINIYTLVTSQIEYNYNKIKIK
ncbi:hypothetical protein P5V15_006979 [Pogonomyrmex californicus]